MRAQPAHATRTARHLAGGLRCASAVLATLALLMQLLMPSLVQAAATNGAVWIEICADAGAVWIEVEDDQSPNPSGKTEKHSECRDCVFCAVATHAVTSVAAELPGPAPVFCVLVTGAGARIFFSNQYERPMTRGPPVATLIKKDPVRSAFMAPSFDKGGAL